MVAKNSGRAKSKDRLHTMSGKERATNQSGGKKAYVQLNPKVDTDFGAVMRVETDSTPIAEMFDEFCMNSENPPISGQVRNELIAFAFKNGCSPKEVSRIVFSYPSAFTFDKPFRDRNESDLERLRLNEKLEQWQPPLARVSVSDRFKSNWYDLERIWGCENDEACKIILNAFLQEAVKILEEKLQGFSYFPLTIRRKLTLEKNALPECAILDYAILNSFEKDTFTSIIPAAEAESMFNPFKSEPSLVTQMLAVFSKYSVPKPVYGILHSGRMFIFYVLYEDKTWQKSPIYTVGRQDEEILGILIALFSNF